MESKKRTVEKIMQCFWKQIKNKNLLHAVLIVLTLANVSLCKNTMQDFCAINRKLFNDQCTVEIM